MTSTIPTLAALVREQAAVSWSRARKLCAEGRVTVDGARCLDPAARVAPGAVVVVSADAPRLARGPLAADALVYRDRDVVVVDKPAGLLTVADEAGSKETLVEYTRLLLRRAEHRTDEGGLGVVHRLDRDTSGLVVFTRTAEAKRVLAARLRGHDMDRLYHAIAHGAVQAQRIESDLLPDRGDGLRGSWGHYRRARGHPPPVAKHAVTHIAPIAALEGATLVECRLETGRQHQIRIHLAEAGHPLLGERVYIRDYAGARIEAARTMLHARLLGFAHPRSAKPLSFERGAPDDFVSMVERLRLRS